MALNRTNDYLFKWLFKNESRKALLLDFINAVLTNGSDKNVISDISFVDTELSPAKEKEKAVRLDILGKTSAGTLVNIEVQVEDRCDIDQRVLYYWSRLHSTQLTSGEDYKDLKATISIVVLSFNHFEKTGYHSSYSVYEDETGAKLNDNLQIHFIELRKWEKLNKKAANRLEHWLLYLANNNPKELEDVVKNNPLFGTAIAAENTFQADNNNWYWYEMREKFVKDYQSGISSSFANGKQQGLDEGKKIGKQEGLDEGKKIGKQEGLDEGSRLKQAEIAKKMLKEGLPLETIKLCTGLSEVDIKKYI